MSEHASGPAGFAGDRSCREAIHAVSPDANRGVLGDRAFALIDRSDGRVASAKQPRKWARLLACNATFIEPLFPDRPLPPVAIVFPDGSSTRSDASDVDDALSRFVGREVTLASILPSNAKLEEWWPDIEGLAPTEHIQAGRIDIGDDRDVVTQEALGLVSPPGTFFDCGPLHLITDATLTELGGHHTDGTVDRKRVPTQHRRRRCRPRIRGERMGWPQAPHRH
ncbi:MAG: hypothetical protein ACRDRB_10085 [Pseudonocardiaceae bacterium]